MGALTSFASSMKRPELGVAVDSPYERLIRSALKSQAQYSERLGLGFRD